MAGVVGTGNSSVAAIAADAVYTGKSDIVKDYASIAVNVYADVASASDGVELQFSADGTNWWTHRSFTLAAGQTLSVELDVVAYRFRVKYTNGSAAQSAFRLQSIYHVFSPAGEPRDFAAAVARGELAGFSQYVWRCHNADVGAAADEDLIENGGTYQWPTAAETVTVTSSSALDDASTGQGAHTVLVRGLDANLDEVQEIISLEGLSDAVGSVEFLRVNQVVTLTCGTLGGNQGALTVAGTTSGYTLCYVDAADGISHSGVYTVPAGKVATFLGADFNVIRPSGQDPQVTISIWVRASGSSPWLRLFDVSLDTRDTSFISIQSFNKASFPAGYDARVEAGTTHNSTNVRARLYLQLGPANGA